MFIKFIKKFFLRGLFFLVIFVSPLKNLYTECKLGYVGTETTATVVGSPLQKSRSLVKYMYVAIDNKPISVMITSWDYGKKRFQVGQSVKVKYHAATKQATLSGEVNGLLIGECVFMLSVLFLLIWIEWSSLKKDVLK